MKLRAIFITALIIFAAGIALIALRDAITSSRIVLAGGILFIIVGLINMAQQLSERNEPAETKKSTVTTIFNWAASGAAVILGVSMLLFNDSFVTMVPRLAGIIVALCALYQLIIIGYSPREAHMPQWLYAVPALMICGAIYIFTRTSLVDDALIMLLTGGSFSLFGVASFFEALIISRYQRQQRKLQEQESESAEPTSLPTPNSHTDSED